MSLDTCEQCGEFINTDEGPEVYRGDSLSCVCDLCWESGASQSIAGVGGEMYLVTRVMKTCITNIGEIDLNTNGLCGMMPVYEKKEEAIAYAKSQEPFAEVLKVERVE